MAAPIVQPSSSKCSSDLKRAPPMQQPPTFHPLFSDEDADVVLHSLDNTFFRVHSYTLKTTSGLFRDMFSLPSDCTEHSPFSQPIPVYEQDEALVTLLQMISGMPTSLSLASCESLEPVLELAEKWDTPGPLCTIRSCLSAPHFLSDPLRLYRIATHFEWEEVAQLAATATLSMYIYDPAYEPALELISPRLLAPLLSLHRQRRELFKISIDSPARFTAGNVDPFYCGSCNTPIDNSTWRALKAKMYEAIDRKPSGECFFSVVDVDEWDESRACWEARCSTKTCGSLNYDKPATLRQVRNCISLLPNTVELDWST